MSIHQARHFVRGHYEGENAFDGHIAHNEPAIGLATDYFWHSGYRSGQAVNLKIQAHKIGHDVYLGLLHRVRRRGIEDDQIVYGVLLHMHRSGG